MGRMMTILMAAFAMMFLSPNHAHAYIDPGSGALIVQVLIAIFLGAAFIFRKWFKIIWDVITFKKRRELHKFKGSIPDEKPGEKDEPSG